MSHETTQIPNYPPPNPFVPETIVQGGEDCGCGCGGGCGGKSPPPPPTDCTLPPPGNQTYAITEQDDCCCCCCCCPEEKSREAKPRPEGGVPVVSTGPGSGPQACLLGLRFSLDGSADESTVTDAFSMRGANALVLSVTVFAHDGTTNLAVVTHGSFGGGVWFSVSSDTISTGQGAYSFTVSDVGFPQVRIGFRATSGSAAIVFGADVYRSCP